MRLDNILVFRSDFSVVKLCDFGSVRTQVQILLFKYVSMNLTYHDYIDDNAISFSH